MKIRRINIKNPGFALPTVLIASVVMLAVLATSVAATASTRSALQTEYYNHLARDAAKSGLEMAKACIEAGSVTWASPLRPGGTCAGLAAQCVTASCYVVQEGDLRTTFEVSTPEVAGNVNTVTVQGKVEQIRSSDGSVWRSYTQTIRKMEVSGASTARTVKWKQVAMGNQHTCAIGSDSVTYCWGYSYNGRLGNGTTASGYVTTPTPISQGDIPAGVTLTYIASGAHNSCGIGSNGKLYCWGQNSNGQIGDNTTTTRATPKEVSAGVIPAGIVPVNVALGNGFTCIIGSNGKAYCWGLNSSGQLGNGNTTQQNTPVAVSAGAVPSGVVFKSLALGNSHSCALAANNQAYCWGYGANGRLGNNSTSNVNTPVLVQQGSIPAGVSLVSIAAGHSHNCAISAEYKAYCWGLNTNSRLGDGTTTERRTPYAVSTGSVPAGVTLTAIANRTTGSCAFGSNNKMYCWGGGLVGSGTTSGTTTPVAVSQGVIPASEAFTSDFSSDGGSVCVIATDRALYCWGTNTNAELGDGSSTQRTTPTAVSAVADTTTRPLFASVTSLYLHSCGTGTDFKGYCWGYSNTGRLGDGTTIQRNGPTGVVQGLMPDSAMIRQATVGWNHSCGISSDNWSYCWGSNSDRQFGNGGITSSNSATPTSQGAVPAGVTFKKLVSGQYHTCAMGSDSKAYCWGRGTSGQLGNNGTANSATPVAVSQGALPAGSLIRDITAGDSFTCVIASDGKPYCWGLNTNNQLGDNTTTQRNTPVAVLQGALPAGLIVRDIDAGSNFVCVIASDGKPYCWGGNGGKLGDGTTTTRPTPVAVSQGAMPTGVIVLSISAGDNHTCAIASDYKAYCWGVNGSGRLGDGTTTTPRTTPVAVAQGAMPADAKIATISAGYAFTCAITTDSQAYCWGASADKQLGTAGTTSQSSPVKVLDLPEYPVTPSSPGGVFFF